MTLKETGTNQQQRQNAKCELIDKNNKKLTKSLNSTIKINNNFGR